MNINDDKIKEILELGFSVEKLVRASADGLSFSQIAALIEVLRTAGPYVKDSAAAVVQYLSATPAEVMDINNYVVTHYGTGIDATDLVIKKWLKIAMESHSLVSEIENFINRVKNS